MASTSTSGPEFTTLVHDRCAWSGRQVVARGVLGSHTVLAQAHAQAQSTPGSSAKGTPSGSKGAATPGTAPGAAAGADAGAAAAAAEQAVASKLLSSLLDAVMECGPAELATSPGLEQVQALVYILQAAHILLHQLVLPAQPATPAAPGTAGAWAVGAAGVAGMAGAGAAAGLVRRLPPASFAEGVLKKLAPHFPATMPAVKPPAPVQEVLVQFNLHCSSLLVSLLPLHTHYHWQQQLALAEGLVHSQGHQKPKAPPAHASDVWVSVLVRYYQGALQQGLMLPAAHDVLSEAHGQGPAGTSGLSPGGASASGGTGAAGGAGVGGAQGRVSNLGGQQGQVYAQLLSGLELAVASVGGEHAQLLLAALTHLSAQLPPKSSTRAACLRLQHKLLMAWQRGEGR